MSLGAIIAALAALFQAIPGLTGLGERLLDWWTTQQNRQREKDALERLNRKNEAVNEAMRRFTQRNLLGSPTNRVSKSASAVRQQPAVDGPSRISSGGEGSTRLVRGCPQDDKRP